MNNNKLKLAFTIFTLILTIGVYAQGPPGGGQGGGGRGQGGDQQRGGQPDASEILSKLDTNNDEVIDKDEASNDKRGKISEDFDKIDSNEDSVIDLEELKDSLNSRTGKKKPKKVAPKKIIKEVDDNGDGLLNELEVAAKGNRELSENFSEIDTNNDSVLDLEELKVFFSKNDNKGKKRKKRD